MIRSTTTTNKQLSRKETIAQGKANKKNKKQRQESPLGVPIAAFGETEADPAARIRLQID